MTLFEVFQTYKLGSIVSLFLILSTLIEITPIPFSPLKWLGKRINADVIEQIGDVDKKVTKVETKLDEHIAESYRNNIFQVQDKLLAGRKFTQEEWNKAIVSCTGYKKYIKDNNLSNGVADEAIKYIFNKHQEALDKCDFIGLSNENT